MNTVKYFSKKVLNKKALFIINPVSGKKQIFRLLPSVIREFMDEGYMVTTMVTSHRGEASDFSAKYGRDFDLICCSGGDGTLNETLNGLARENIHVPLGYIPCGSTNDFANSHSLSKDILTACKNAASGTVKDYDIGCFGKQYFTYLAAFGAFSWLAYTTDQTLKNMLGHTAYILEGIKDLTKVKPVHLKMTAGNVLHEDDYIFGVVSNSLSIGGALIFPDNLVDTADGILEVLLIKMPKSFLELDSVIRSLVNQDFSSPLIDFFQASDIYVENPEGLEWSLDGERSGFHKFVHIKPLKKFLHLKS